MTSEMNDEIYCPTCQKLCDASVDLCPSCGHRFNKMVGRQGQSIVRPAGRPKMQCDVDLATTVDRTGSSERFQTGIPKTFEIIVSQVAAKARSVKCWLQSHGDLDEGQKPIIHTDGGTPDQAIKDIRKISYGGGGDAEEHHLDAVESLLNRTPWRADPSRARRDHRVPDGGYEAGEIRNLCRRPWKRDQRKGNPPLPRL